MNKKNISERRLRACIYFIYDKEGVVDEYIIDQLKDLKKNTDFIHCVINGKLNADGKKKLEQYADEVYVRENKGLDVGAYQAAIRRISWEKLERFDEVIFMNFTCFGPVYPFSELFTWADQQDVDFWTITENVKFERFKNYLHQCKTQQHYQSYFIAVRKTLFGSELFRNFFEEIPEQLNYHESGHFYEYAFPGYFEERGYKGTAYYLFDGVNYPLLHDPVKLLKKCRIPLIKKRSFFHIYADTLHNSAGEATLRLINYLKEHTDYNIDRIWDSVLRSCDLSDVVRCAQLNRILPKYIQSESKHQVKVGLVYHAYYDDLFDDAISYIANMPADAGILLTTNTEEKKAVLEQKLIAASISGDVIVIENRGRDISSLLVGAASFVFEHDLICFAHDKKSSHLEKPGFGRAWAYKLHENVLGSKEYVHNVISLFEEEKRLGIAFPPYPSHGPFDVLDTAWTGNFSNAKQFLQEFGINVKIDNRTLCIAPVGTCFWFRPAALQKLFAGFDGTGWTYNDFPSEPNNNEHSLLHCIERVFAYFAQDKGYYPAFLYTDEYARIELSTLEFMKYGSHNMRYWNCKLTEDALNGNKQEKVLKLKSMRKVCFDYYRYKIMSKITNYRKDGKYRKKYMAHKQMLSCIKQNADYRKVAGKSIFSAICNYYRYKLLSLVSSGEKKNHYKDKCMKIKNIFKYSKR